MEDITKILLGNYKNISSVATDSVLPLYLNKHESLMEEYSINDAIDAMDVFENEKNKSDKYYIYGHIEYLSLVNQISTNFNKDYSLSNLFGYGNEGELRDIYNSFEFYLVIASSEYEIIKDENDNNIENKYSRKFRVIATNDDIQILNCGFEKNIFNEQKYIFVINKTINIENLFDGLGYPITSVYLYARYKRAYNPMFSDDVNKHEVVNISKWDKGNWIINAWLGVDDYTKNYKVGDFLNIYDIVENNPKEYTQNVIHKQKHYIKTKHKGGIEGKQTKEITWNYNPLIEIKLKDYSTSLSVVSENETRYDVISTIPNYISKSLDGYYRWRDTIRIGSNAEIGDFDKNIPFINGHHYIYSELLLPIVPDLEKHNDKYYSNNEEIFIESGIFFEDKATDDTVLLKNDLSDINKRCRI